MNIIAALLLGVFAFFWSAITIGFDAMISKQLTTAWNSQRFIETEGKIVTSKVRDGRGKRNANYSPEVSYQYAVNGSEYLGGRISYGNWSSSFRSAAEKVVARYPAGGDVRVFHDPRSPGEAVLEPGINGSALFATIFLTPFNIVMLGVWWAALAALRSSRSPGPAGGVPVIEAGMKTRARLSSMSPSAVALITLLASSFVMIFVLVFATGGNPSVSAVTAAWIVLAGCTTWMFCWRWNRIASGAEDLTIDDGERAVTLPQTFGRKEPTTLRFEELQSIEIERVSRPGRRGSTTHVFAPTVWLKNSGRKERLAELSEEANAIAFQQWLTDRLGLPAH